MGGADAGGFSVFTRIIHPGGILLVNTNFAGTNYNTVVSVFRASGSGLANGANSVALACADDAGLGAEKATLSVSLTPGYYIIMISKVDTVSATLNLQYEITYTPPAPPPANDDHTLPLALTAGVQVTQGKAQNIHHVTDSPTEQGLNSACQMYNSVWYSFTAPDDGFYRFNSAGSFIRHGPNDFTEYTMMGIYTPGTLTLRQCVPFSTLPAASDHIYMYEGDQVLVRLGSRNNFNLMPDTVYKIRASVAVILITKPDPYLDSGAGWVTKNWSGSDNFSGSAAHMTAGSQPKSISNTRANLPPYIKWNTRTGRFYVLIRYTKTGSAPASLRLTITYADGTAPTRYVLPLGISLGEVLHRQSVRLASPRVKRVTLSAVLGAGTGTLSVSELYTWYQRNLVVARDAAPLPLPMPGAP